MKDERKEGKSNGRMKNERKINWKMDGRKRGWQKGRKKRKM